MAHRATCSTSSTSSVAAGALVGQRRVDVAVGDHDLAPVEGGLHDGVDVLGLVGGVEQRLGAVRQLAGLGAEHDPAQLLAHRRVAGLEGEQHGVARVLQPARASSRAWVDLPEPSPPSKQTKTPASAYVAGVAHAPNLRGTGTPTTGEPVRAAGPAGRPSWDCDTYRRGKLTGRRTPTLRDERRSLLGAAFLVVFFAAVFFAAVFLAAAFFAAAFLAAFFAAFLAGPRSRRSASSSAARSRVIASTVSSLRRVALYSPSVTYSPKRPAFTTTGWPETGSLPSSLSGGAAAARPRCLGWA